MERETAYQELLQLHSRVSSQSASIQKKNGTRVTCHRGCSGCCSDGLTVFEVEAERIRVENPGVLSEEPGARGGCAFLDAQGACRVYASRPYVCRTQGLPLVWYEEVEDEVVANRSICHLNAEGPPLETLEDEHLWLIGPTELGLQDIQDRFGGSQARTPLRDLFSRPAGAPESEAPGPG